MNTEQTLASAENQLEKEEQQMECLHEWHRVSTRKLPDGTEFATSVCIHCNAQQVNEV